MSLIIGLTGGIATGKSTVASFFKDQDIPVIDTDKIAKNLLNPGSEPYLKVIEYFSDDIIHSDGQIHRKRLAKKVFEDEKARQFLNKTLHPEVKKYMMAEIGQLKLQGSPIIVADVPLLFESGFDKLCDLTLCVYIPQTIQLERLMIRDEISKSYALKKIKAQMSMKEKKQKSDLVIDNSKSILETKKAFNDILSQMKERL